LPRRQHGYDSLAGGDGKEELSAPATNKIPRQPSIRYIDCDQQAIRLIWRSGVHNEDTLLGQNNNQLDLSLVTQLSY